MEKHDITRFEPKFEERGPFALDEHGDCITCGAKGGHPGTRVKNPIVVDAFAAEKTKFRKKYLIRTMMLFFVPLLCIFLTYAFRHILLFIGAAEDPAWVFSIILTIAMIIASIVLFVEGSDEYDRKFKP